MSNLLLALQHKYPGIEGLTHYEEDDRLVWENTDIQRPGVDQLAIIVADYELYLKSVRYKEMRAKDYPSIAEQLDTMYHLGYNGWKAEIRKIKDRHPKPGVS